MLLKYCGISDCASSHSTAIQSSNMLSAIALNILQHLVSARISFVF
ncbi:MULTISPECIES: hypothetical protein [unclassified Microcoleus]